MTTTDNKITLILDYDGTLHDSCAIYEPAFRQVIGEISDKGWIPHKEYTSAEITVWVGYSAKEMWDTFHPELSEEQKSYVSKKVGQCMVNQIKLGKARLYKGVLDTLDLLAQNYNLIFLSNCGHSYMEAHKEAFKLDRWFSAFYCTGDYGFASKEEVFAKFIQKPNINYIAVGDRIKDITLAKTCNLKSVGCCYGFGSREELATADILIEAFQELPDAIIQLIGNTEPEPEPQTF